MLMDLFYENCPVDKKMRLHYNQFMLSFHQRMSLDAGAHN